jgi:nicotinate phosphoribosyltransferase
MEPGAPVLLTDLYELTMLQSYHRSGMNGPAVFEFFVRSLPAERHFLLAAGLEQVLDYLAGLGFDEDELAFLRGQGFDPGFLDSLRGLRFTGDVDAVPEGSAVFADEPLLRIRAPLREAQLIESRVVNLMQLQTMVASKAARTVLAAHGKRLVDFGMRRAHGAEAALLSARASYLAGFDGTSNVEAGRRFGIALAGTMAHSFVQAHRSEEEAFAAYVDCFPDNATMLIDTYDLEAAAALVVRLAQRLRTAGRGRIAAVRIDSGDLLDGARRVRAILDAGQCRDIGILVSGNLDEYQIDALEQARAPVRGYGVGTRMNTSADRPYLDCGYKLVEYCGRPCCKLSPAKATWPGVKQVFRRAGPRGEIGGDRIGLAGEQDSGAPLLEPVMRSGRRLAPAPPLGALRERARAQLDALPAALRSLGMAPPYPVVPSPMLESLRQQVAERLCSVPQSARAGGA